VDLRLAHNDLTTGAGRLRLYQFYQFPVGRIGLCLSLSTTIGGVLGELAAGPVIDRLLHNARAKGDAPLPETRLKGMYPAVVLLPVSLQYWTYSLPC
jgi:hypothetical protein